MNEHLLQNICQTMLAGQSLSVKLVAQGVCNDVAFVGGNVPVFPTPPLGYRYDAQGKLCAAPVFIMRVAPSAKPRGKLSAAAWPALGMALGVCISLLSVQYVVQGKQQADISPALAPTLTATSNTTSLSAATATALSTGNAGVSMTSSTRTPRIIKKDAP